MSRTETPTPRERRDTRPKYQVLLELGRGGMGVVQLAMGRGPQGFVKLVVLKMLKPELLGSALSRRMFSEEARISARLSHPNVVQVYEVIEFDGAPTLVMEYLDGQPLSKLVEYASAKLPPPLELLILTKVLAGLHACHELRDYDDTPLHLVHRDISPHNVFVLYDGQVKVVDFGIAKTAESRVDTQVGEFKGKMRYVAPEQALSGDHDRRVDVFSVGVILAEALTGKRFWGERSDAEVMLGLLTRQLPPAPSPAEVHPELARICAKALAAEPEERYPTALEFQRDLERYLADQESSVTSEALAGFLCTHFATAREERNALIHAQITLADRLSLRPAAPEDVTVTTVGGSAATRAGQRSKKNEIPRWPLAALVAVVIGIGLYTGLARFSTVLRGSAASGSGAAPPEAEASPLQCVAHTKACEGTCVSKDRPDRGCGGEDCKPCTVPNATARCNSRQSCDIAICYRDYEDCDGDPNNGCETNVRIDPDHCGGCGKRCVELPHATRGCGDICTIWRCEPGYSDCNGSAEDGCEVHVVQDRKNCGRCGAACAPGRLCREGRCG